MGNETDEIKNFAIISMYLFFFFIHFLSIARRKELLLRKWRFHNCEVRIVGLSLKL